MLGELCGRTSFISAQHALSDEIRTTIGLSAILPAPSTLLPSPRSLGIRRTRLLSRLPTRIIALYCCRLVKS